MSCKILAIIPARSGSKRIPHKNIKMLGGKPLVAWSIEAAIKANKFYKVVVSSDDEKIAAISREYGAEVPFLRNPEFASDTATVINAVLEVVEHFERNGIKLDAVMLLQPTSPFRSVKSIDQAIELYTNSVGESVVSVSRALVHPYWCKKVVNGILEAFVDTPDDIVNTRSQDLPEAYQLNGAIYLSSLDNLKRNKSFYSKSTHALVIESEYEGIDIDTPLDWLVAEAILKNKRLQQ